MAHFSVGNLYLDIKVENPNDNVDPLGDDTCHQDDSSAYFEDTRLLKEEFPQQSKNCEINAESGTRSAGKLLLWVLKNEQETIWEETLVDDIGQQEDNVAFSVDTEANIKTVKPRKTRKKNTSIKINSSAKGKFICIFCTQTFPRRYNLFLHIRVHTEEKPFKCGSCKKWFNSAEKLIKHKARSKRYSHNIECPTCDKIFSTKTHLKIHQRVHTGVKPYSCQICSRKFGQSSHLKRHLATHKNAKKTSARIRKFNCVFCDKAYYHNDHLYRHIRVHVGEKPEKCGYCDKEFHETTEKSVHIARVHVTVMCKSKTLLFECLIINLYLKPKAFVKTCLEITG